MNQAEASGLNLSTFRSLVAGRGVTDADDIAAVLHHRVDRCIATSPRRRTSDAPRIVGLFLHAIGVTDEDIKRGLDERAALIDQRARNLATEAIERHQPWATKLGTPPEDPAARAAWLDNVTRIAAYRDCWNIHDRTNLGPAGGSTEQLEQRKLAEREAVHALAIHHGSTASEPAIAHRIEPEIGRTLEL